MRRSLLWLAVIGVIVIAPVLAAKYDTISWVTSATDSTVSSAKEKYQEITANRAIKGETLATLELEIHAGINVERVNNDGVALKWDNGLAEIARGHSYDMSIGDYYGHVTPEGTGPNDRLRLAGLSCQKRTHSGIAENITAVLRVGFFSPDVDQMAANAVESWMGSTGHRQNLLTRKFGSTGIGAALGTWEGHEAVYVTQVFC